jgi:hypothetical protein
MRARKFRKRQVNATRRGKIMNQAKASSSDIQPKVIASCVRAAYPSRAERVEYTQDLEGVEGDVVAVEVVSESGSINMVEDRCGRDVRLYRGDKFVAVLANRHSGTSEYGGVDDGPVAIGETIDLLAVGGIVGRGVHVPPHRKNGSFLRTKVLGAVLHEGKPLNLLQRVRSMPNEWPKLAPIVLVCGTAAEVGKTTTATQIIRAFRRQGMSVAAAKLTGTGRLRDILAMVDASPAAASDFPDEGLASTYTHPDLVVCGAMSLLSKLTAKAEIIVAELGGDIIEANIPALIKTDAIRERVVSIVHVSADVLGMLGSLDWYGMMHLHCPVHLAMPIGRSEVGTQERLAPMGLKVFNSLVPEQCDAVVEAILTSMAQRERQPALAVA